MVRTTTATTLADGFGCCFSAMRSPAAVGSRFGSQSAGCATLGRILAHSLQRLMSFRSGPHATDIVMCRSTRLAAPRLASFHCSSVFELLLSAYAQYVTSVRFLVDGAYGSARARRLFLEGHAASDTSISSSSFFRIGASRALRRSCSRKSSSPSPSSAPDHQIFSAFQMNAYFSRRSHARAVRHHAHVRRCGLARR